MSSDEEKTAVGEGGKEVSLNPHYPEEGSGNPHYPFPDDKWSKEEIDRANKLLLDGVDGPRRYDPKDTETKAVAKGKKSCDRVGRLQVEEQNGLHHLDSFCIDCHRVDNHGIARAVAPDIFRAKVREKEPGGKRDWSTGHKELEDAINKKLEPYRTELRFCYANEGGALERHLGKEKVEETKKSNLALPWLKCAVKNPPPKQSETAKQLVQQAAEVAKEEARGTAEKRGVREVSPGYDSKEVEGKGRPGKAECGLVGMFCKKCYKTGKREVFKVSLCAVVSRWQETDSDGEVSVGATIVWLRPHSCLEKDQPDEENWRKLSGSDFRHEDIMGGGLELLKELCDRWRPGMPDPPGATVNFNGTSANDFITSKEIRKQFQCLSNVPWLDGVVHARDIVDTQARIWFWEAQRSGRAGEFQSGVEKFDFPTKPDKQRKPGHVMMLSKLLHAWLPVESEGGRQLGDGKGKSKGSRQPRIQDIGTGIA